MASPVDVVIAVDGMEAEQARVTALFSDTLASDETTVDEPTNLMHECQHRALSTSVTINRQHLWQLSIR